MDASRSPAHFIRLVLILGVIMMALTACDPFGPTKLRCEQESHGSYLDEQLCLTAIQQQCPYPNTNDPAAVMESVACQYDALDAYFDGVPPTATPALAPVNASGICEPFALTSPLDGLPNGQATFYWDYVLNDNPHYSYRVVVMDMSHTVLVTLNAGHNYTVSGDVSQNAIGGDFAVWVRADALAGNQVVCSDEHYLIRAAPDNSQPPPLPTRRNPFGT